MIPANRHHIGKKKKLNLRESRARPGPDALTAGENVV